MFNYDECFSAKLSSCLEEIHNILGESRPDAVYTETIIRHKYNLQPALDELLSLKGTIRSELRINYKGKTQIIMDLLNDNVTMYHGFMLIRIEPVIFVQCLISHDFTAPPNKLIKLR